MGSITKSTVYVYPVEYMVYVVEHMLWSTHDILRIYIVEHIVYAVDYERYIVDICPCTDSIFAI